MNKKELLRTVKFVLFSASAGIIEMSSFTLLNELFCLDYWLSALISLVLSVIWNFTFNRKFTFKTTGNVTRAMLLVAGYYCVFTPASTYLMDYLAGDLCWNEYIVKFLNMLLNMVTEFLFQRFVVYRNSVDNNEKAKV